MTITTDTPAIDLTKVEPLVAELGRTTVVTGPSIVAAVQERHLEWVDGYAEFRANGVEFTIGRSGEGFVLYCDSTDKAWAFDRLSAISDDPRAAFYTTSLDDLLGWMIGAACGDKEAAEVLADRAI